MTHPLGSIKHLATDTLKTGITLPARVAARAYGVAKGAASVGVRAVSEKRHDTTSPWEETTVTDPTGDATAVNVVEELGLDPAPVDLPETPQPITSIDAQADPESVEVTPADVAERLSGPESRSSSAT